MNGVETAQIFSAVATLISIVSLVLSQMRRSNLDAKKLEGRLVTLEQHQFLENDRNCLKELELKMRLIWSIIEKEFPKLLKEPRTPYLDELLEKVEKTGLEALTKEQLGNLIDELGNEYELAKKDNSARALMIAFLKGSAELVQTGLKVKDACKTLVRT